MELKGHTYRGGSAGNAHKPNSNKYRFLKGGVGEGRNNRLRLRSGGCNQESMELEICRSNHFQTFRLKLS